MRYRLYHDPNTANVVVGINPESHSLSRTFYSEQDTNINAADATTFVWNDYAAMGTPATVYSQGITHINNTSTFTTSTAGQYLISYFVHETDSVSNDRLYGYTCIRREDSDEELIYEYTAGGGYFRGAAEANKKPSSKHRIRQLTTNTNPQGQRSPAQVFPKDGFSETMGWPEDKAQCAFDFNNRIPCYTKFNGELRNHTSSRSKKNVFTKKSVIGGLESNMRDSGCKRHLSWRKRTPSPPQRPWLVSWIIIVLIGPPLTTAVFAGRLAQLTPTSREAERSAIARALRLGIPAPLPNPAEREPLRDDVPQARAVLCARTIPNISEYLSSTGIKKPSRLEWHVHPPYIPIRRRRAGSCAPIDRLHSAYGSAA